jgi:hypothetical protein
MPDVEMQDVAGGGRICFRGDDRPPSVMFNQGFFSRKPASKIKYNEPTPAPMFIHEEHGKIYEQQGFGLTQGKGNKLGPDASTVDAYRHAVTQGPAPKGQAIAIVPRTPDINLLTSVCITPRFSMAVLFPPKQSAKDFKEFTWVYAVYVRQLYNTHAQQVCDGLQAIKNELAVRDRISMSPGMRSAYGGSALFSAYVEDLALWTLYAQELATKKIEAGDIICAVEVFRSWHGVDFTYGCDYQMLKKSLEFNKACTLDKVIVKALKAFFKNEPEHGTTPSRSSGFHKDDENTRSSVSLQNLIASLGDTIDKRRGVAVDGSDASDSEWD